MKELAGLDLDSLDASSLSDLQRARDVFASHYKQKFASLDKSFNMANIMRHFDNYVKLVITPAISANQQMSLIMYYLPDNERAQLSSMVGHDSVMRLVHKVAETYGCKGLTLKQLIEKFDHEKIPFDKFPPRRRYPDSYDICHRDNLLYELDYMDDWDHSVSLIYDSACAKNLDMALVNLRRLIFLTNDPKIAKSKNLEYIYSMQLAYHIDVLVYLSQNLADDNLRQVYEVTKQQIELTLKKLRNLPEPAQVKPQRMFFSGIFTGWSCTSSANVVVPSLNKLRADL